MCILLCCHRDNDAVANARKNLAAAQRGIPGDVDVEYDKENNNVTEFRHERKPQQCQNTVRLISIHCSVLELRCQRHGCSQ